MIGLLMLLTAIAYVMVGNLAALLLIGTHPHDREMGEICVIIAWPLLLTCLVVYGCVVTVATVLTWPLRKVRHE